MCEVAALTAVKLPFEQRCLPQMGSCWRFAGSVLGVDKARRGDVLRGARCGDANIF